MISKLFRCELPQAGRAVQSADCEDRALEHYAEMARQGYECRIEKYDSYIEDEINDKLIPTVEYAVGCTAPASILIELSARERFLENVETIEDNNGGSELCPMDYSRREPTSDEVRNCDEVSSWQASEEIAEYVREKEVSEDDRQRLVAALVKAVEITLRLGPERVGIMNRNGVKLWRAFEILGKVGMRDDGMSVRVLMHAIRKEFHDHDAIVALARIAPNSKELNEARRSMRHRLPKYLSGTVDPYLNGKIVESRISYYGAISVIAPGSEFQAKAWKNLCGNWDRYPEDQPWVASYLGKLEPFCVGQTKGEASASGAMTSASEFMGLERELGETAMFMREAP